MSSESEQYQSTPPISQCPKPAISVSGTAWAMSEPTSLAVVMCE